MSDKITIYYYTAWDGFAWQGCDEATAKSLQRYMEATKTLPRSSADRPPFGGAVPCKVAGEVGVAVYRYHTRVKGDLSGRDSLYIALAFVPLSVGCIDFAKLLELPQLAEVITKRGELEPDNVSASDKGLRLEGTGEMLGRWMDTSLDDEYCILNGRSGLATLSRLFFSEKTQLGFLNAVFTSESGIDGLKSTQTYSVYPEVGRVAEASAAFKAAKRGKGHVLDEGHTAVVELKAALDELDARAKKLTGYPGLQAYHDAKESELKGDKDRIAAIKKYVDGLNRALDPLPDLDGRNGEEALNEFFLQKRGPAVSECVASAMKIEEISALDKNDPYRQALGLALQALKASAYISGAFRELERVQRLERQLSEEQAKTMRLRANQEKADKEHKEEIARLRAQLERESKKPHGGKADGQSASGQASEPVSGSHAGPILPIVERSRGNKSFWERLFNLKVACWVAAFIVIVGIVVLGVVLFKEFTEGPETSRGGGQLSPDQVADVFADTNDAPARLPEKPGTNNPPVRPPENPGTNNPPARLPEKPGTNNPPARLPEKPEPVRQGESNKVTRVQGAGSPAGNTQQDQSQRGRK